LFVFSKERGVYIFLCIAKNEEKERKVKERKQKKKSLD